MQNAQALQMLQLQQQFSFQGGAQLVNGYRSDESVRSRLHNNSYQGLESFRPLYFQNNNAMSIGMLG